MKILFLYPLWSGAHKGISGYFVKTSGGTYIPYNLALLAAIVEKEGHEAKIIDGELERISLDEITNRAKEYNPDIIVLTAMTPFYNIAVECAEMLKNKKVNASICVGGPHLTIMQEKAFFDCFDFGFVGEGEESWKKFVNEYKNKNFNEVPGLMYRDNETI